MPNPDPSAKPTVPQQEQARPTGGQGDQVAIGEDLEDHSWKALIFRPFTLAAAALLVGLLLIVAFFQDRAIDRDLPLPEVSYSLQRNEGLTEGIPVAVKINQVTVFLINDPMDSGAGAERAKGLVTNLEATLAMVQENPGKTVTLDMGGELPEIIISEADGTQRRSVVQLQPGDLSLAGDGDGKRVARVWAERLTDAIKVFIFGEEPKFSTGTAFGDSLGELYSTALEQGGAISKGSLESAYASLNEGQRQALENLAPLAPLEELEAPPPITAR